MLEWMKYKMGMGGGAYVIFPFAAICSYPEAHGKYNYTLIFEVGVALYEE